MAIANITGNILTDSGVATSSLLPLTGGTLTGALNGTSATFSGEIKSGDTITLGAAAVGGFWTWGSTISYLVAGTGKALNLNPNGASGTTGLSIATNGDTTFSRNIVMSGTNAQLLQTTANSVAGDNVMVLYNSNANSYGLYIGAGSGTNHALYITDSTRTANLFKVQGNGNVGFGTGSPIGIGGGYTTLDIVGSNGGGFLFGRTSNKSFIYADNGGGYFGTETAVPLIFYTNTTEKMRITSGGYVCINTSSVIDDGLISIAADANLHQGIVIRNTNASSNIYYIYFKNSSNAAAGRIEQTGATSVSYASGSDYRLKEDLKDFDGLNKVLSIKTYDFKWKDEDRRDYGVLAHELQEVVSGAVLGQKDELEEDGTIKTQMVDYSKIVPVLVKAIQELSAKVSALENKS